MFFFCDNCFFFPKDFLFSQKKNNYHKKKTIITFHFFYWRNCHFRFFKSEKMQKVSPPGILSLQFCQKYFFLKAWILRKKIINLIKVSETDFRIRLVESQNHGMKANFCVKNRKPPVPEAINVKNFLFRNWVSICAW